MNTRSPLPGKLTTVCLCGAACLAAHAQVDDDLELAPTKNRLMVGARFGFSINARISNNSTAPLARPYYDDGYVAKDSSGNAGGKTWNWGYDNASQIVGGNFEFHSATSPRDNTTDEFSDSPHPGVELGYARELGRLKVGRNTALRWGAAAWFGTSDVNLNFRNNVSGTVTRNLDRYAIGAILPPGAPYYGSYDGPGPMIGGTPVSSGTDTLPLTSHFDAKIDGLVYGGRLGPYAELPLGKRFTLQGSAGLAIMATDFELSYTESFTINGGAATTPPPTRRASESSGEIMVGFYGNLAVAYQFSEALSFYVGGQYQHLGETSASAGTKTATIDLGNTMEVIAGIKFEF